MKNAAKTPGQIACRFVSDTVFLSDAGPVLCSRAAAF